MKDLKVQIHRHCHQWTTNQNLFRNHKKHLWPMKRISKVLKNMKLKSQKRKMVKQRRNFPQRKKRKCLGNIPISNWKFILLKERDFWQWTEELLRAQKMSKDGKGKGLSWSSVVHVVL